MKHLEEAKKITEDVYIQEDDTWLIFTYCKAIAHALIAIAENMQQVNTPNPAIDWFVFNDGLRHCRYCGIPQAEFTHESHSIGCLRRDWSEGKQ